MYAVLFEVEIAAAHQADYLEIAASLQQQLNTIDGFISVQRYQSLTQPGKLLSLSFWRDEAAILKWRNLAEHRQAQARGRATIFLDYRLRVMSVVRDYGMHERQQAPQDSRAAHQENQTRP